MWHITDNGDIPPAYLLTNPDGETGGNRMAVNPFTFTPCRKSPVVGRSSATLPSAFVQNKFPVQWALVNESCELMSHGNPALVKRPWKPLRRSR